MSVRNLGPQWSDSFGPEPVVSNTIGAKNQGRPYRQANVYRGETREIYPTPEYPDPARASREDPKGLLNHWSSGNHPWPPDNPLGYGISSTDDNGDHYFAPMNPISTGVHWTESPQTIPERFTEDAFKGKQSGRPLTGDEITSIGEHEQYEAADYRYTDPANYDLSERVDKRSEDGTQAYRDLSHREYGNEGRYNMGVIWHGKIDATHIDRRNLTTNYEDEVNLKPGSEVPVHAMQVHVKESGHEGFPGPGTTPDIVRRAGATGMDASPYQMVGKRSIVPWSVAQFGDGEKSVPIRSQGQRGSGL